MSDYPAMTYEQNRIFYQAVEADYADIPSKKKRFEKIREKQMLPGSDMGDGFYIAEFRKQ